MIKKDKSVFDKMAKIMLAAGITTKRLGESLSETRRKPSGSKNHNQKTPKKKRLMTKTSRRINRKHAKKRHK